MKLLPPKLIPQNARVLIGVSGGKDSMALLHALLHERPDLTLFPVHINHQLRPDSKQDADFVESTLKSWGLPCLVYTLTQKPKGNIEEWARHQRYTFFEKMRQEQQADFLLTAHHQGDDVESFFLHLFRGTRVKGMSGMEVLRKTHLRPLLHTPARSIQTYIETHQIPFKEDPSNQDQNLKRNWLRHTLIPQIETSYPGFTRRWQSQKSYWSELQNWMESEAESFLQKHLDPVKGLDRKAYAAAALPLRYSILECWLHSSTKERISDQKTLERWDQALLSWPSGKKTEWASGFFLALQKKRAKVVPIV